MPRREIDLPYVIEYLSVLDDKGNLDGELEPNIPNDLLLKIHRGMLLTRRFDERMVDLQRQGRIGTFGPVRGHEASHIGAAAVLQPSDWMVPSFREVGAEIWRGKSMESVLLYYGGFDEGGAVEEGRNDLPIAVPVGSQTLHAVGIGYGIKYRHEQKVALVFFGDGATSEGDFHEAMNFAAVFQLPVLFVCQNNQWAISVPRSRQTRSETLAQKAIAYGMPGIQVDGNDVLAVYSATSEAAERARSGGGPTLIECVTYRTIMHTTADDPRKYRSEDEALAWMKKDPIPRFQQYLLGKGVVTQEQLEAVDAEIKAEIQAAVDRAERQMETLGDPLQMFEHAYSEMTPDLLEQREELMAELMESAEETVGGIDSPMDLLGRVFDPQAQSGDPAPSPRAEVAARAHGGNHHG